MHTNYTLKEFLKLLSACSGDEAIELIRRFQAGAISVETILAEEL